MIGVLIDWVLQPVGMTAFFLLLLILVWLLFYGARPRLPFLWAFFTGGLFWLLASAGFSNYVVWKIENWRTNSAQCDALAENVPVVVLTGGLDKYVLSDDPYQILSRDSLLRVLRAQEVAGEQAAFYITGGVSHSRQPAEMMASVLIDQGVGAQRIVTENVSGSTAESAVAMRQLLPPADSPVIQLITSYLHVPRASSTFEKQGYEVCSVATDTLYSPAVMPVSLLPYISGLQKSTRTIHELIAVVVYRLKGWM